MSTNIALSHLTDNRKNIPEVCCCASCILWSRLHKMRDARLVADKQAKEIGRQLRAMRIKTSLRSVAEKAKLSPPFISDVELGRRCPTVKTLGRILKAIRSLQ